MDRVSNEHSPSLERTMAATRLQDDTTDTPRRSRRAGRKAARKAARKEERRRAAANANYNPTFIMGELARREERDRRARRDPNHPIHLMDELGRRQAAGEPPFDRPVTTDANARRGSDIISNSDRAAASDED